MNQEDVLNKIVNQGMPDKRMERIIRTIITDGEKNLSASDFEYYCVRIPELIKLMNLLNTPIT